MIVSHAWISILFFLTLSIWQVHQQLHYVTVKFFAPLQQDLCRGLVYLCSHLLISVLACIQLPKMLG